MDGRCWSGGGGCRGARGCGRYIWDREDDAHRYAVYLRAWGYTTALHPAASPAAFTAGHLYVKERDIAVGLPEHVIITGTNLLTKDSTEHDVAVGPPAHSHAKSAHPAAPHAPAPYWPPLPLPRRSAFD